MKKPTYIGIDVASGESVSVEVKHDLTARASDALRAERCICGRHKGPEKSFCPLCYNALPVPMRANLFATFKDGYAVFFGEAVQFLRDHTTRFKKVSA